jgi:hypothetical protein
MLSAIHWNNAMKSSHSLSRPLSIAPSSSPQFNFAEQEFQSLFHRLTDRIVHRSPRPDIEMRILAFLMHATGPDTEGIARKMGVSAAAAAFHLQSLVEAGRVWSQPVHGREEWHISHEGRHFLAQCGPHWQREAAAFV